MNENEKTNGPLSSDQVNDLLTELVDLSDQYYRTLNTCINDKTQLQLLDIINGRKDQILKLTSLCPLNKLDFYEALHRRVTLPAHDNQQIDELAFKFIFC